MKKLLKANEGDVIETYSITWIFERYHRCRDSIPSQPI